MGCQTEVELESNLTFSITTHDPDTGIVTDADAVPTYRVYEDITEAAILNGNMDDGTGAGDQFDDANTTGFYVKRISCTAANGFEANKSYNIYIEATVDGDKGAISYTFRVTNEGDAAKRIQCIQTQIINLFDEKVEDTMSFRQALRLFLSVLTGKSSGGGTATINFRDIGDTKDRISATVDADGNRTAIGTRDGS